MKKKGESVKDAKTDEIADKVVETLASKNEEIVEKEGEDVAVEKEKVYHGLSVKISDDKKSIIVKGVPELAEKRTPETIKVEIQFFHEEMMDNGSNVQTRVVSFIINPDSKDMWDDLPVPVGTKYMKDNGVKRTLDVQKDRKDLKNVVGASLRGRSHAHEGKPRDDDFEVEFIKETGWYILVVADGAGSAKYSREGSKIACETVIDRCKEILSKDEKENELENAIKLYPPNSSDEELGRKMVGDELYKILVNAAFEAKKRISQEAEKEKCQARDYATTLLTAICKRFEQGWFVGTFWIGDGAITLYDKEKHESTLLGVPDEGEYGGQTRFVTMNEVFEDSKSLYGRLRFKYVGDFTALMLMSDGVSDAKFETDNNLKNVEKWDELWKDFQENGVDLKNFSEQTGDQLLKWLEFWAVSNHDDRTIVILY